MEFKWDILQFPERKNCKAYAAPFDVRLNNSNQATVVQPDFCVICDFSKLDHKGCNGAPDLIIEILSPGNTENEMKIKYDLYEENGVKEYWIVDTELQYVLIHSLKDGKYSGLKPIVNSDLINSRQFPDLKFLVGEIFE